MRERLVKVGAGALATRPALKDSALISSRVDELLQHDPSQLREPPSMAILRALKPFILRKVASDGSLFVRAPVCDLIGWP